jgi:uncharacterized membrane protein YoaK (UPF0700 family)
MKETWRLAGPDLLLLSFAAGSADAAGFISFDRVFTCNMTGNVVLFGISIGQGNWGQALRFLYVLLMFVLGTALGMRMSRHLDEKSWPVIAARVIGIETGLLVAFAISWALIPATARENFSYALLALLTPAMGLQTAALYRFKAPGVQTTALTSTITTFVKNALGDPPAGASPEDKRGPAFTALVIVLYTLGALTASVFIYHLPRVVGCIPAAFVLCVFLRNAKPGWAAASAR